MKKGSLFFFCGKMGAGKTTASVQMASKNHAVLLSEDEWLSSLYPGQILSLEDYSYYSKRLKIPIKKLVQSILQSNIDVVMDFPANTPRQRQWFKSIFDEIGAPHALVYIDVDDEICLQQIRKRRTEQPDRAATDTSEMFGRMKGYFEPPLADEGFTILKWLNS